MTKNRPLQNLHLQGPELYHNMGHHTVTPILLLSRMNCQLMTDPYPLLHHKPF